MELLLVAHSGQMLAFCGQKLRVTASGGPWWGYFGHFRGKNYGDLMLVAQCGQMRAFYGQKVWGFNAGGPLWVTEGILRQKLWGFHAGPLWANVGK